MRSGPEPASVAVRLTEVAPDRARSLANFLGIGQICSWGSIYYCFPLIALAMETELGWTKSELYGALTFGLLFASLFTYPVGIAIDRGHGRHVMAWSSVAAAAVMIWWSMVHSLVAFYLLSAALGAIQAAILYEPAFAVLARRVGPGRARAGITTITLWGGFASTVFIPLEQLLLDQWGWRDSLWVLAAVNLVCALGYLYWVRPELDVMQPSHAKAKAENIARDKAVVRQALRGPVFWLLLLALSIYAGTFSAFTFHMYPILQELNISTIDIVQALAVIGPAQVAGRILITLFAARTSMRLLGSIVISVFPLVFALLAQPSPNFWMVATIFTVYGLCNGIFTIVRSLVAPEMLSQHAYGALNGLLVIPMTIARAVAPLAAAWLWATDRSYHLVLVALIWSSVLLLATFWTAGWVSWSRQRRAST